MVEGEQYLAVQKELSKGQKQIATLQSENAGLKSMSAYSEQRSKKLESQVSPAFYPFLLAYCVFL